MDPSSPDSFPTPPQPPRAIAALPPNASDLAYACAVPCIRCDYNLQSIPIGDRCPECGAPAADSLDSLALANPEDLRRVRVGTLLLVAAGAGVPIAAVLVALLALLGSGGGEGGIAFLVGLLIFGAGPSIAAIGCSHIAHPILRRPVPGPDRPQPAGHNGPRIRQVGVLMLIASFVLGLAILVLTNAHGSEEPIAVFGATVGVATVLLYDVRNILLCRAFARICSRFNRHGTRRVWNVLGAYACVMFACHALIGLGMLAAYVSPRLLDSLFDPSESRSAMQVFYMLAMAFMWIVQFGTLGWMGAWSVMLIVFNRRLLVPQTFGQNIQGPVLVGPSGLLEHLAATETAQRQNPQVPLPPT